MVPGSLARIISIYCATRRLNSSSLPSRITRRDVPCISFVVAFMVDADWDHLRNSLLSPTLGCTRSPKHEPCTPAG
jgi:hypothetical protein